MANTNIGINLTTLATGTTAAKISTTSGATQSDGTTSQMFISSSCYYSQITTATVSNNAYTLPVYPIIGQTYTIRNDGASPVSIFPGSSTSIITTDGGALSAGTSQPIGTGNAASFLAISTNGALNTATGASVYNNPLVNWQVSAEDSNDPSIVQILTGETARTLTTAQSGTTFIVPAMGAACAITLPSNASGLGVTYTFRMNGTAGNALTFTAATATTIKGVYGLSGGIVIKTAATTCVITATAVAGDVLTIVGDGTNWYVTGIGSAAASFS